MKTSPIHGGVHSFKTFFLYLTGINRAGRNLYPYTRYVPHRTNQFAIVRREIDFFDFNGFDYSAGMLKKIIALR